MTLTRKTPLRADPAKTAAWQNRSRKPLARNRITTKPTKRKVDYEAELDALTPDLLDRSKGRCEARIPFICTERAVHRHHRKLGRGKGTQDSVEALLHTCYACHSEIHRRPAWSRSMGFIVRQADDPVQMPVSKVRKVG